MPSNVGIPPSPSKRRAHRSASSSSLFPSATTAHARRPSRIPHVLATSLSSHNLAVSDQNHIHPFSSLSSNSSTSSLPSLQHTGLRHAQPPLLTHPFSVARLGAAVDSLLRRPAKGKPPRPRDPLALFILFSLFLAFFLALLIFLLSSKSTFAHAASSNAARVADNLARVRRGLPPKQFWPLPDSRSRALASPPQPFARDVPVNHVWRARRFPPRSTTAFRDSASPLRLTVVAACKDRTAYLQTMLPRLLSLLHATRDEVVLVDWGSSPPDAVPLAEVVRASSDQRLSVVTLAQPAPWALSRAYNLGFALARGQFVLKLDCDTLLASNFFEKHAFSTLPEHSYYRFRWDSARDPNEAHLNGVFLARTAHVRAVHGFDERITTYGWDDSDLYARLETGVKGALDPLTSVTIDAATLSHMPHSDALRASGERDAAPLLQTQLNSQAVASAPSWSDVGNEKRTTFRLDLLSADARFVSATQLRAPKPLLDTLDSAKRADIEAEATSRVLHDSFSLPWGVLSETNRDRPHLLRALSAYAKNSKWTAERGVVIAELRGSTSGRVVALASLVALARKFERPLFVAWGAVDGALGRPGVDPAAVKVTDVFRVDDDAIVGGAAAPADAFGFASGGDAAAAKAKDGPPVFVLGRLRCGTDVADCARSDPVFAGMGEFRARVASATSASSENVGDADAPVQARAVEAVLRGATPGRGIVVRLDGPWPGQARAERESVLRGMRLAGGVQRGVDAAGDVSKHVGAYLGRTMRARGVDAMVRRLRTDADAAAAAGGTFYFAGENADMVAQARAALPGVSGDTDATVTDADDAAGSADEQVARAVGRAVGELAVLARCREMVNDGRPPDSVLEVVDAWRQQQQESGATRR